MPSLRAKIVFFLLKHLWAKHLPTHEVLRKKKSKYANLANLLISSQPVKTTAKEIEGVKVDVVEPAQKKTHKIVIYIHGGGFVYESTAGHYELVNRLAVITGATIFTIHYKLAPEYQFPTQIHEVEKVYLWLLAQGYKAKEIIFVGDSAGGNIALGTTIFLRDKKKSLPAGIIAISAPTDATFSYPSFMKNKTRDFILTPEKMQFFTGAYRGKESATNPLISPTFANLKGLPKMQLFVSDNELPFDDIVAFSKKLQKYGVECELHVGKNLMHGYPLVARFVPEAQESIKQMAKFINEA